MNDIKVAISVFDDSVSQRFDCAREIIFIEIVNGKEASRKSISTNGLDGIHVMKNIVASETEMIVCGVMPCFYRRMADSLGIKVMSSGGNIEEAIKRVVNCESCDEVVAPPFMRGRRLGMEKHGLGRGGSRCRGERKS